MRGQRVDSLWLRIAPSVVLLILLVPVIMGLAGVLLPAFGYFPAAGAKELTLEPWRMLSASPGVWRSTILAAWIGLASTLLSCMIVIALFAQFHDSAIFGLVRRTLSPLLSVPHVAIAIGLAFVIAPSGLIFRLLSQGLPGLDVPPDLLIVHDSFGISLIGALVLKEVPFLFLMSLAGLPQAEPQKSLAAAVAMGYKPAAAWLKVVLPRLYPQLRLPVLAVLAYSLSVVDAALILGPTNPPPLAVAVVKLMNDPDLGKRFVAAAGAVQMAALTVAMVGVWLAGEFAVKRYGEQWAEKGGRHEGARPLAIIAYSSGVLVLSFVLLSTAAILLWAFAESWPYPKVLPSDFTTSMWKDNAGLFSRPLWNALVIGLVSACSGLFLTVSLLERDVRSGAPGTQWLGNFLYVPLIVPQVAFLPGLQIALISLDLDSNIYSVIAAHVVFVLPYIYLSLSRPWLHFDDRFRQAAMALGASPRRALFRIRLPMLTTPLLIALAVGFAVSIGQYLPTVLLGGGRVPTVTTEAVALSSGGDRRMVAALALLQALLPFAGFLVATLVPLVLFRNRRDIRSP
ncbi:MAG TPA: ABC transporter permease subunit [Aestuariivirgaceae bacterium]|nr:ABC transporter permease subunit [Aestuariivirgaceae bacterium]